MVIWNQILTNLKQHKKVVLIIIVEHKGSSPGKQGFKMILTEDGKKFGTVGGGATEYSAIKRAEELLKEKTEEPEFIDFIHRDDENNSESSGMICSGECKILFYPLKDIHKDNIQEISGNALLGYETTLIVNTEKFVSRNGAQIKGQYSFKDNTYSEVIGYKHIVIIAGGGHVSLALSKQLKMLGYYIRVYDNRKDLETLKQNNYADEKSIIDFNDIDKYIPDRDHIYAVITSFTHQNDKLILSKLLRKKLFYLGMMGSKKKVKEIFKQLKDEGFSDDELSKVYSPIGVDIKSETPEEIAVSIAAEIIDSKNRLST